MTSFYMEYNTGLKWVKEKNSEFMFPCLFTCSNRSDNIAQWHSIFVFRCDFNVKVKRLVSLCVTSKDVCMYHKQIGFVLPCFFFASRQVNWEAGLHMFTYCFREPTNKQEDKRKRNEEIQEWLEEERYRFTSKKKGLKARNLISCEFQKILQFFYITVLFI